MTQKQIELKTQGLMAAQAAQKAEAREAGAGAGGDRTSRWALFRHDVATVKTDVGGVKTDVAATKSDLETTKSQLNRAVGDAGVMSGVDCDQPRRA